MRNLTDLTGKTAVISGGASGIGLATAKALHAQGAKVLILDLNEELGNMAAKELSSDNSSAAFLKCNVTLSADCEKAAITAKEKFGKVDVLFNNAGVTKRKSVVDLTEAEWDFVVDVSLKGAFLLSKYMIPVMAAGGGGSIINTGSGWALKGGDDAAAYCAAKGGLMNLTRAMAIDHGKQNIRVNCVCPGDTDTPLLRDEGKQLGINEAEFLKMSATGRPLERLGTPEDIANAVVFFASDLSLWVTGTHLVVDGGGLA